MSDSEASAPAEGAAPEQRPSAKLFLGGLSWDTTEGRERQGPGGSRFGAPWGPTRTCADTTRPHPPPLAEKLRDHFGKYGSIVEAVSGGRAGSHGTWCASTSRPSAALRPRLHPCPSLLMPLQVVMRDRQTGRPRGFGFVTFTTPAAADAVVQDVHVIDGRQVRACCQGAAALGACPRAQPAGWGGQTAAGRNSYPRT